jgi:predicted nucleic acid-binding protein
MPGDPGPDFVLDASVAAKAYFLEDGSDSARNVLKSGVTLLSPDLLFIEMASVGAKRVRRGVSTLAEAAVAVAAVRTLIDRAVPVAELADRALEMACKHGFSAYDAAYLVLAQIEGAKVLTADERFVRRARDVGLGHLMQTLAP